MNTSTAAMSPQFRVAIAQATTLLASTSRRLPRIADGVDNLYDENDLLYLGSTAQLAGCRGRNLVNADKVDEDLGLGDLAGIELAGIELAGIGLNDLLGQLVSHHDLLIDHISAMGSFAVLEFINDVGLLCYGLRRYVERH